MSSHTTRGRYILAYHLSGEVVGAPSEYADMLKYAEKLQAADHAGGRWAVHELGPEITNPTNTSPSGWWRRDCQNDPHRGSRWVRHPGSA